jgi:hypothetical protein
MPLSRRELTAAFITAAYIEISNKVEKIRDIVDTWLSICQRITVENKVDYISMILSTGRIKDMDAQHYMDQDSLMELIEKIKTQVAQAMGQ